MIPEELGRKLLYELLLNGNASTQTTHLRGQLCALVDMAMISDGQGQELRERFSGRLHPLITEPGLEALTPLSATLIEAPASDWEGQHRLVEQLSSYNSDIISVWITSTLSTPDLAAHLRQATFTYEEVTLPPDWSNYAQERKGEQRYLLRYYDPLITPVLYGDAPDNWQQWFFAPILSWWFAQANSKGEQWYQIAGRAKTQIPPAPRLMLTDELMQALAKDPIPYRILNALEEDGQTRFSHDCRGVRLARVKEMLATAYQQGFSNYEHLRDFVQLGHQTPVNRIITHPNWAQVKRQVLGGGQPLAELCQHTILNGSGKTQS